MFDSHVIHIGRFKHTWVRAVLIQFLAVDVY